MAAAALVAQLTWTVILALHPGGIWALEYRPAIIWIGLASLTVAVTATLYAALRNRIRAFELAVGGLLWWLLLAAATSVVFPPASYLFTWPLVFSLLGLGILFAGEGRPTPGWRRFTVLMITGIPAAFLAASGVYGITMTRELLLPYVVPLFAAAIVLMLGLLIPHLDLIARAGRWVLPVATAALALGLLLAGSLSAGFDARHPQPDSILYALNTDTGQAIWVSADEKPDAWTAQFLGATAKQELGGGPSRRSPSRDFTPGAAGRAGGPERTVPRWPRPRWCADRHDACDRPGPGQPDRARDGHRGHRCDDRRHAGRGPAGVEQRPRPRPGH